MMVMISEISPFNINLKITIQILIESFPIVLLNEGHEIMFTISTSKNFITVTKAIPIKFLPHIILSLNFFQY